MFGIVNYLSPRREMSSRACWAGVACLLVLLVVAGVVGIVYQDRCLSTVPVTCVGVVPSGSPCCQRNGYVARTGGDAVCVAVSSAVWDLGLARAFELVSSDPLPERSSFPRPCWIDGVGTVYVQYDPCSVLLVARVSLLVCLAAAAALVCCSSSSTLSRWTDARIAASTHARVRRRVGCGRPDGEWIDVPAACLWEESGRMVGTDQHRVLCLPDHPDHPYPTSVGCLLGLPAACVLVAATAALAVGADWELHGVPGRCTGLAFSTPLYEHSGRSCSVGAWFESSLVADPQPELRGRAVGARLPGAAASVHNRTSGVPCWTVGGDSFTDISPRLVWVVSLAVLTVWFAVASYARIRGLDAFIWNARFLVSPGRWRAAAARFCRRCGQKEASGAASSSPLLCAATKSVVQRPLDPPAYF